MSFCDDHSDAACNHGYSEQSLRPDASGWGAEAKPALLPLAVLRALRYTAVHHWPLGQEQMPDASREVF